MSDNKYFCMCSYSISFKDIIPNDVKWNKSTTSYGLIIIIIMSMSSILMIKDQFSLSQDYAIPVTTNLFFRISCRLRRCPYDLVRLKMHFSTRESWRGSIKIGARFLLAFLIAFHLIKSFHRASKEKSFHYLTRLCQTKTCIFKHEMN